MLVARDPEDRTDLVITFHGDAIFVSFNILLFPSSYIYFIFVSSFPFTIQRERSLNVILNFYSGT